MARARHVIAAIIAAVTAAAAAELPPHTPMVRGTVAAVEGSAILLQLRTGAVVTVDDAASTALTPFRDGDKVVVFGPYVGPGEMRALAILPVKPADSHHPWPKDVER